MNRNKFGVGKLKKDTNLSYNIFYSFTNYYLRNNIRFVDFMSYTSSLIFLESLCPEGIIIRNYLMQKH